MLAVANISQINKEGFFMKEFYPHKRALYNFALKLTSSTEKAKDLLQDTMYKAFKYADKFEPGTNSKAWMFRILQNTFINLYRKSKKSPSVFEYEDADYLLEVASYKADGQTRKNESQGLSDEMQTALHRMPEDYRLILLLCDIEEFKYEEISKMLDIPLGTVKTRIHKARNILKTEYERIVSLKMSA